MKYSYYVNVKGHNFTLISDENYLLGLKFGKVSITNSNFQKTPIIKEAITQLEEYFNGERQYFTIKLKPEGTEFQTKVWKNLGKIPYGQTISYKSLAETSGNPKASRAVGMANNKNPIPIFIPCHRVIASNGKLQGYAGGIELKKELLNMEKKYANN